MLFLVGAYLILKFELTLIMNLVLMSLQNVLVNYGLPRGLS
jgi:hypothetical protein